MIGFLWSTFIVIAYIVAIILSWVAWFYLAEQWDKGNKGVVIIIIILIFIIMALKPEWFPSGGNMEGPH